MRIQKKKYACVAGLAGVLFIFMMTLIIFASQIIDAKYVREKIVAEVTRKFGTGFNFQSVDISFFPVPRVSIRKAVFAYPEKVGGTAETVRIYPHLFPLLCGNIRIAKMQVESPVFFFDLSYAGKPHTAEEMLKEIFYVLNTQLPEQTGFVIAIKKGSVTLAGDSRKLLTVHNLESRIDVSPEELRFTAGGSSDFSGKILIKAQAHKKGRSLPEVKLDLEAGEIDIPSARDAAVSLFGDASLVHDIFAVLKGGKVPAIRFQTHGGSVTDLGKVENIMIRGALREGVIFTPRHLTFRNVSGKFLVSKGVLEGEDIAATLGHAALTKGKVAIGLQGKNAPLHIETLARFNITALFPLLQHALNDEPFAGGPQTPRTVKDDAEGRFVFDSTADEALLRIEGRADFLKNFSIKGQMQQKGPSLAEVTLYMEGRGIDVSGARNAAFSLFGDAPLVSNIFTVLKGGTVPSVSFQSHGGSFVDLGKAENIMVRGTLHEGDIFIPGPRLAFRAVNGDCVIAGGILKAEHTSAWLGHAALTKGKVTIGLQGKNAPLHLEAFAQFNVPELYLIFQKAFKERALPRGLKLLEHIKGTAAGSLVWGDSLENMENVGFRGEIKTVNAQNVPLDFVNNEKGFNIRRLVINDAFSRAAFTLNLQGKIADLTFDGILRKKSLEALVDTSSLPEGFIQGRFAAHFNPERPLESTAQGNLKGEHILIPWKKDLPLAFENISLKATAHRITLQSAVLRFDDTPVSLHGTFDASAKGIVMNVDAAAETLAWKTIGRILAREKKETEAQGAEKAEGLPVRGALRLRLNNFLYDRFTLSPLLADIAFAPEAVSATVTQASVCGISLAGEVKFLDEGMQLYLKPQARAQQLQPAFACIAKNKKTLITGVYDFDALLKARGKSDRILKSLNGKIDFSAKDGRIYQSVGLAKIFSVINIEGIFEGGLPDLIKEGFAYRSFVLKGDIEKGKIILREAIIDSPSMELVGEGTVDLVTKKIDMKVLAAPLKPVDVVLRNIPLVKNITGRNFISVPVTITGNLDDPEVSSLSASSVGSGILGVMEKILKAPVHIFFPEKMNK